MSSKAPRRPKGESGPAQSSAFGAVAGSADPFAAFASFGGGGAGGGAGAAPAKAAKVAAAVPVAVAGVREELPSEFKQIFKKLAKRDAKTKVAACQELCDAVNEKPEEEVAVLIQDFSAFVKRRHYAHDKTLRKAICQCLATLFAKGKLVKKKFVPCLGLIMAPWMCLMQDNEKEVAAAAKAAWDVAFDSPGRAVAAITLCETRLVAGLAQLLEVTPETLREEDHLKQEESETVQECVQAAALRACAHVVGLHGETEKLASTVAMLSEQIVEPGTLYEMGESKHMHVRGAVYGLISSFLQSSRDSLTGLGGADLARFMSNAFAEKEGSVHRAMWPAVLLWVKYDKAGVLSIRNPHGTLFPRLYALLRRTSGIGGSAITYKSLYPLLALLGTDIFGSPEGLAAFADQLLGAVWAGLRSQDLPLSGFASLLEGWGECWMYFAARITAPAQASFLVRNHLAPAVRTLLVNSLRLPNRVAMEKLAVPVAKALEHTHLHSGTSAFFAALYDALLAVDDGLDGFVEELSADFVDTAAALQALNPPSSSKKKKGGGSSAAAPPTSAYLEVLADAAGSTEASSSLVRLSLLLKGVTPSTQSAEHSSESTALQAELAVLLGTFLVSFLTSAAPKGAAASHERALLSLWQQCAWGQPGSGACSLLEKFCNGPARKRLLSLLRGEASKASSAALPRHCQLSPDGLTAVCAAYLNRDAAAAAALLQEAVCGEEQGDVAAVRGLVRQLRYPAAFAGGEADAAAVEALKDCARSAAARAAPSDGRSAAPSVLLLVELIGLLPAACDGFVRDDVVAALRAAVRGAAASEVVGRCRSLLWVLKSVGAAKGGAAWEEAMAEAAAALSAVETEGAETAEDDAASSGSGGGSAGGAADDDDEAGSEEGAAGDAGSPAEIFERHPRGMGFHCTPRVAQAQEGLRQWDAVLTSADDAAAAARVAEAAASRVAAGGEMPTAAAVAALCALPSMAAALAALATTKVAAAAIGGGEGAGEGSVEAVRSYLERRGGRASGGVLPAPQVPGFASAAADHQIAPSLAVLALAELMGGDTSAGDAGVATALLKVHAAEAAACPPGSAAYPLLCCAALQLLRAALERDAAATAEEIVRWLAAGGAGLPAAVLLLNAVPDDHALETVAALADALVGGGGDGLDAAAAALLTTAMGCMGERVPQAKDGARLGQVEEWCRAILGKDEVGDEVSDVEVLTCLRLSVLLEDDTRAEIVETLADCVYERIDDASGGDGGGGAGGAAAETRLFENTLRLATTLHQSSAEDTEVPAKLAAFLQTYAPHFAFSWTAADGGGRALDAGTLGVDVYEVLRVVASMVTGSSALDTPSRAFLLTFVVDTAFRLVDWAQGGTGLCAHVCANLPQVKEVLVDVLDEAGRAEETAELRKRAKKEGAAADEAEDGGAEAADVLQYLAPAFKEEALGRLVQTVERRVADGSAAPAASEADDVALVLPLLLAVPVFSSAPSHYTDLCDVAVPEGVDLAAIVGEKEKKARGEEATAAAATEEEEEAETYRGLCKSGEVPLVIRWAVETLAALQGTLYKQPARSQHTTKQSSDIQKQVVASCVSGGRFAVQAYFVLSTLTLTHLEQKFEGNLAKKHAVATELGTHRRIIHGMMDVSSGLMLLHKKCVRHAISLSSSPSAHGLDTQYQLCADASAAATAAQRRQHAYALHNHHHHPYCNSAPRESLLGLTSTLPVGAAFMHRIADTTKFVARLEYVGDLALAGLSLLCRLLRVVPTSPRRWVHDSETEYQELYKLFVQSHLSQDLIQRELASVIQHGGGHAVFSPSDELTVRVQSSSCSVVLAYDYQDTTVSVKMLLPPSFPLSPIEHPTLDAQITRAKAGLKEQVWRRWLMKMTASLLNKSARLWDCVELWQSNLTKHFDGQDACPICYQVVNTSTQELPSMKCTCCQGKYHKLCLFKWFKQSNNSTCPLCRAAWYSGAPAPSAST